MTVTAKEQRLLIPFLRRHLRLRPHTEEVEDWLEILSTHSRPPSPAHRHPPYSVKKLGRKWGEMEENSHSQKSRDGNKSQVTDFSQALGIRGE
jgi:hypothetical protein